LGQNVSDLPLFRRCLFRCFVAVIGRCFETKNDVNSETWQGMVAKFLNRMSGIGRVSGGTRTHLSDASAGLLQIPLHLQQTSAPRIEKGGIGRDAPACICPADAGGTGGAL
jgi:hypothetical protein